MKLKNNWKKEAVCASDKYPERWVSYNKKDVEYARSGCSMCTVKRECLFTALSSDSFVGVVAGISEYEYLTYIWHEAEREDESNWTRDNSTFSRLLREIP